MSYAAILVRNDLGYDLVPEAFLDFNPAAESHLHDIPALARPVASSAILTNNLQVSLIAFDLGLTFGAGTAVVLV